MKPWKVGLSLEKESLKSLQVTNEEGGKKGKEAGDRLENKSNVAEVWKEYCSWKRL